MNKIEKIEKIEKKKEKKITSIGLEELEVRVWSKSRRWESGTWWM